MAEALSIFKKYFRASLLAVPEVQACVSDRVFNIYVPDKAVMPYAVFQIVPLQDIVGQGRQSSGKNFLVNLKFLTGLPVPDTIYPAIENAEIYFRMAPAIFYEDYSISIRHDRPIEYPEPGATPGEKLLNLGSTYRVWMTGLPT
ncbi:hypothetical protein BH10ACI2_BH10ACI2_04320 [soil metagenome]